MDTVPPVNLEKQIKRHVIGRSHGFYAMCTPGLEETCARELARLSDTITVLSVTPGGVGFSGRLEDLMRANLHLRTAGRVLMRLATFNAANFRQLRKRAAAIAWDRYLPEGCLPLCKVSAHRSRLYHSGAVSDQLTAVIADFWQHRHVVSRTDPGQVLYLRLEEDVATVSLDGSGANLYLRGIKRHGARAPLRETLAAGILHLAGYDPDRPLLDPMCGGGTFSLEAALIAKRIAPGLFRQFAFMQWPAFRQPRWRHLTVSAREEARSLACPMIHASDTDADACRGLEETVERFAMADAVRVSCRDFFSITPTLDLLGDGRPGLVVLNPPYGRRLISDRQPRRYYKHIGEKLHADFRGWQAAVILPEAALIGSLPLGSRATRLSHGGLTIWLQVGIVS